MRLAIAGGGVVGGGVVEILANQASRFAQQGLSLEVGKLLVRDATKARDFTLPAGCEVVTSIDEIVNDDSIDMVVELIGGVDHAKELVFRSIESGKHVVTANKALVAAEMGALTEALAANPTARLGFEAAVCGGIPIIHTLQRDYAGDCVTQIAGIMNGTTNFILSKMEAEGADFGEVLKEAQDLGFAEADPSADVDGYDARAKIAILSRLAFGVEVAESDINCKGITAVSADDFEYAAQLGATIKLLGVGKVTGRGGAASGAAPSGSLYDGATANVYVSPCVVPSDSMLAGCSGAGNIVEVRSTSLDTSHYVVQGAGRYPTANSVVSDIVQIGTDALAAESNSPFPFSTDALKIDDDVEAEFYVRINVKDEVGIIKDVSTLFERHGVSIYSILQAPNKPIDNTPFVITTHTARMSAVSALADEIEALGCVIESPLVMPILSS